MYVFYFAVRPLIFVTLVFSLPGYWEARDCPQGCTCLVEDMLKKVYCDIQNKQQLRVIPSRFPADTQYISLKGNRISSISARAFLNLRELIHLDLASNRLQSLPQNVFQSLTSLESLNLSKNRLGQLPSGLLNGLNSLRDLYLDGNVLEILPKNFFQGLTSLRRLYLDSNKFYTLSHNLFDFRGQKRDKEKSITSAIIGNLTSLVELLLNHNGIAQVRHDSFNKMSDLKRLKLNNNNITTLPRGIFRDLKSLRLLSLYKNPFQCTCSLKWLKNWIVENRGYVTIFHPHLIRCEGPGRLRGRSLLRVGDSEFGCRESDWSHWTTWNSCSKLCDNGQQSRTRTCQASEGCEGSDTETRWCNTHKCEPGWSEWTIWTTCSVTCAVGYQTRSRSTQCTKSPCIRQLESEVRACPRKACPSYTEWSAWSMCDAVCGQGTQVRKRECTTSHLGVPCLGSKVESQNCSVRECASWSEWNSWSTCSKSCSRGEETRQRDCVIVHGLKQDCLGSNIEKRDCNIKQCPVDGGWSSWLPWSMCSKSCGLGFNTRYRHCSNPYPQNGGAHCKGSHIQVTECIKGICSDEAIEFTPWTDWSQCSSRCGQGFQFRRRTCKKQDPNSGIDMCLGNSIAYQICEGNLCERRWGEWTPWSKCYGNCIRGQSFRLRFCVDDRGQAGYTCTGNRTHDIARKSCKPSTCSYSPVWSAWSSWSGCSKSCAGGVKRRWRYCVTKVVGKQCPGNQESKEKCNTQDCPIHGGWSSWSDWGECNRNCGGGIKQRNRTCTEPVPKYNGHECVGDSKNISLCNTHSCKLDVMVHDGKTRTAKPTEGVIKLHPYRKCPTPQKPMNGKFIEKAQRDQHRFLEYRCDEYYRNIGHSTIRYCLDGEWSGEAAECVPDCGEIQERMPENRLKRSKSIQNFNDAWPWHVAIKVPILGIHCGGSLIGDQWVLTAAHCVLKHKSMEYYKDITVILGTYNLTDQSSPYVQVISVNRTEHHRDFDWDKVKSDIAILKLARKVNITKYVHPICLPNNKRRKRLVQEHSTGVMVGWGARQKSHLLRQIPLPVVSFATCQNLYRRNRYDVTKKMLCAGYNNRTDGTCKKDSGGGFVFLDKTKRRIRWVLGGITSWRYPTWDKMGKYSVFTDVTKHFSWIAKKMRNLL